MAWGGGVGIGGQSSASETHEGTLALIKEMGWEVEKGWAPKPKRAQGEVNTAAQPWSHARLCFMSPCVCCPPKRRILSTESGSGSPSSVPEAPIGISPSWRWNGKTRN